ncbi:MAG TPA: PH domain-containing protein [Steroidobacteraceae bacterium]|nr:PH domain-containing protein [Steroidobacteraceae bacterium]
MNNTSAGTEPGLGKALEYLRSVLIPSETLEAWAIQRRIFALTHRRLLIAATSGRLILLTRKVLGGYDVSDIRWQDLEEVTLRVGMLGADLLVRAGRATDLASQGSQGSQRFEFKGLRKDQGQAVYRICQAQDQAWREKRRVRELEELRARSGGIQVTSGAAGYGSPGAGGYGSSGAAGYGSSGAAAQPDAVRRLQEAKQMLDAKLITDAEYEAIKARIVSS